MAKKTEGVICPCCQIFTEEEDLNKSQGICNDCELKLRLNE